MSLSHKLTAAAVWFALLQWFANVVCGKVHITCPRVHAPADASHANLVNANPLQSTLHTLELNNSCFAIDIALNVENILPDPSYIVPETNLDIIANALQSTLSDGGISIDGLAINALHRDAEWSTVNQCPQETDETVRKFYFETVSYDITCDETNLKIVDEYIECEFQTPPSLAYQFMLDSAKAFIAMRGTGAQSINIDASVSDVVDVANAHLSNANLNSQQLREFVFSPTILTPDSVYWLRISVDKDIASAPLELGDTLPVISVTATPNACRLGKNLAEERDMHWGLAAFCNIENAEKRSLFESHMYQKHSSQTYIPTGHVRRRLEEEQERDIQSQPLESHKPPAQRPAVRRMQWAGDTTRSPTQDTGRQARRGSLWSLDATGVEIQIADDIVAPNYEQCIAVDPETLRIFSVGGNDNGAAVNRLAVHQIDALGSAQFVGSLPLDKARSGAMCHYWKNSRGTEEYIIVINGMDTANNANVDDWFNDIVFIPLNRQSAITFPEITLKHNVIDMKTYIADSDQLYLIGGRNGYNAVNHIQSIDLQRVLDAAISNDGTVLYTVDRTPMALNLVRPFVDLVHVRNQTCFMIFGGQNVVNNEWIDTQIPSQELQLLCNDNLPSFDLYPNRFSAFDEEHLVDVSVFDDSVKASNDIFVTSYNFTDDDIWYEFSASFKVCGAGAYSEEYLTQTMNALETDNGVLRDHLLTESQTQFKEWNHGFSDLTIADVNYIRASPRDSAHNHCVGLSHSVCDGLRITGNGGDQACGYNPTNNDCYAIQRIPAGLGDYANIDDHNAEAFEPLAESKQLPLIVVLIAVNVILVLLIAAYVIYYRRTHKKDRYSMHTDEMQNVEVVPMDGVHGTTANNVTKVNEDEGAKIMFAS